jgi:hypothetical protein
MAHRLGYEFVHDIRIGRGPLAFRFGLDAYIAGSGVVRVGPSVQSGRIFDQGALIALWGEALCFPASWDRREDVRWEPIDDTTARLVVNGPEGQLPITVGFHPGSGCPAWCEAERYKGTGPKVRWRGISTDWARWADGVIAPGRFRAHWADEPAPWIDLRVRSLRVNVPVDRVLALGERAMRGALALSPR